MFDRQVVKNDMKRVEGELSKSKMEINKLLSEQVCREFKTFAALIPFS